VKTRKKPNNGKVDYDKRMKTKENAINRKKKLNLIIQDFKINELMDETGEVKQDTFIQISFEGILINLSIPVAMRLCREIEVLLNVK
jgi:hypothetical protein